MSPARFPDLRWGIGWGLAMAALFSLYALVVSLADGSAGDPELRRLIASYLLAGVSGGALVGALRPRARHSRGAVVVGMLVGFVVYVVVGLSLGESLGSAIAFGAIAGGLGGALAGWDLSSGDTPRRYGVVVPKDEAPRLRVVQVLGVSAMILGSATCSVFAASDSAVFGGFGLFAVGFAAVIAAQLALWVVRLRRTRR